METFSFQGLSREAVVFLRSPHPPPRPQTSLDLLDKMTSIYFRSQVGILHLRNLVMQLCFLWTRVICPMN